MAGDRVHLRIEQMKAQRAFQEGLDTVPALTVNSTLRLTPSATPTQPMTSPLRQRIRLMTFGARRGTQRAQDGDVIALCRSRS